jgi:cytochrome c oxidase subunit 1
MILPVFGMVSEIIPVFSRKPMFGYKAMAASLVAISFLGMIVWAHHMFTTPTPTVVLAFFMLSSFAIAVPTGIKIFNWLATLWRGALEFRVAMMYACALPALFVIGGISGVILAIFPVDWQLQDTYFVVAHLHYVLFGGSVFGIFAGLYYWFPKMSGRMLSEALGKASFWTMFVGFNLTFLIQHSMGLDGMPRRIYRYSDTLHVTVFNEISTVGSFILGIGVLMTFVNVLISMKNGKRAGNDPWRANTLEWFVSSPPPPNNFDVIPRVRSVEPMKDIRREIEGAGTATESVAQPLASGT